MHVLRTIGMLCLGLGIGLALPAPATAQVRTLKAVTLAGKRYVALKDLAAMYGLPLTMPGGKTLLIRGQYTTLQFAADSRQAVINGGQVWLHAPITKVRGLWSISDADAQYVVDPLVRPSAYLGARGARTVVLDPGHGAKDPGAISRTGYKEKDLALDIALRVKAHLVAAGVNVVMTREIDRFWELEDRPFLAARGGGDAFVSIHLNTAATRAVQGVETFVTAAENYPPTAAAKLVGRYPAVPNNRFNHSNMALGNQIQRSVVNITRAQDRGVKRARFIVLRDSAMPAALVECGFLSNPQEEQRISTTSYRETLALGIAQGILNYFALVNRARVDVGAPVIQRSVPVAAPAAMPVANPAPVAPVAAIPAVAVPVQAAATYTPAPVVVPVVPAAMAPAVPAPPAPAAAPAPAPAPRPAPVAAAVPAPRPMQAIAPPPLKLLNPSLVTRAQ